MVSSSAEKMAAERIKNWEESGQVHRAAAAAAAAAPQRDFIFHFGILSRQILGLHVECTLLCRMRSTAGI